MVHPMLLKYRGRNQGFDFQAKAYEDAMMEVYPAKSNGLCVIMCPGGAYYGIADL